MKNRNWVMITVAAVSSVASAFGASPSIGVATANGTFQVNGNNVSGNATVMEGSKINTEKAWSLVQLNGGARLSLAANSVGQVFSDRAVMERGSSQLTTTGNYRIEAGSLRIEPASSNSELRVNLSAGKTVQVAAVRGNLLVKNNTGIILANMMPGTALAFDPQESGASMGISIQGVLRKVADHVYILTDKVSNTTYQVIGCDDFGNKVNKEVKIDGTLVQNATLAPVAVSNGATQEVRVRGCGSPGIYVVAATTAAAISTSAIIAGVAVAAAGTGIGLGVALTQGNTQPASVSP